MSHVWYKFMEIGHFLIYVNNMSPFFPLIPTSRTKWSSRCQHRELSINIKNPQIIVPHQEVNHQYPHIQSVLIPSSLPEMIDYDAHSE